MLSKFKKLNTSVNQTVNSVNKFQKILVPVTMTKRDFQSYTKAKNPGFLDSIGGVYEDTRQGLFLKMDPFRDGNFFPYYHHLSNKIIYLLLLIPTCSFLWALFYYTMYDSCITFDRKNIHPNLKIDTPQAFYSQRNPVYFRCLPFGSAGFGGIRTMFYDEIESAINQRKNEAKQMEAEKISAKK
eukprot:gene10322-2738_t